jgi:cytosine deaminase
MDLLIRNARLAERPREHPPVDIGIDRGRIAALGHDLGAAAQVYDANGRLACAGLIESHIHIDKSRIIERCAPQERRTLSPILGVAPLKKDMSVEDVRARAARTLEQCILHGTTRMRTQVEVDPGIGMRGFDAVRSLVDEYKWAIDIEMCVFPQEGLTNYPGTDELLVEAMKRGARVLGGAPRYDTDGPRQIERIFQLAREYDADIDLHLDVGPTPEGMHIHQVRELTEKYRRGGRVVVGHMAKLSLLPPAEVATLARRLGDAGIAVTVLPATDLFLMGRDQEYSVRRGVADANLLVEHGVQCSLSTNNVLNPATPYGDCSLVRMANLYANVIQLDRPAQLRECFNMLSARSARVLNYRDYGFALGNPGDVVIFDADSPEQAVAEIARPIAAFKNGRQTVRWHAPELLKP